MAGRVEVVFKRRDKQPLSVRLRETVWPRRGWSRVLQYIKLRLNRIPDSPQRIARGIAAGVLASFTPLFGFHLFLSAGFAWLLRGNLIASLIGSLIGNPVTFPFIAMLSLGLGRRILGHGGDTAAAEDSLTQAFSGALHDAGHNIWALFTGGARHWDGIHSFVDGVFLPYLVGGLLPGLACATIGYLATLSLVSAYQARRRARLRAKLEAARKKIEAHAHE